MNVIQRLGFAIKAAATTFVMSFGRTNSGWGNWRPRGTGEVDFAGSVGDGRGNSIVRSALNWMGKKLPNGVLSMRRILANGDKEDLLTHPFLTLMRKPNDFYSGATMLKAAHADWTITGDAYLLKVRNGLGSPLQLWYAPSTIVEPVSDDPLVFVQYYRYTPGDREHRLRPEDVIHLRNGIDPNNVRKGLAPLAAIARELFIDDEASRWTAAMLYNGGGPGIVMSPDGDTSISPDDIDPMKAQFKQKFGGANRGEPMIASQPIKLERITWSPKDMDLGSIHDLPEERVCAVLNMPAVVTGMGTGLDSATYSNLASLREVAIEDNLLPTYYDWAEQLKAQLLPDFEQNPDDFEVYFDVSGIRELQPDFDKLVERETRKLLAGGITLAEFRKNVDEDALEGDAGQVMYIPANVVPTALDAIIPVALPTPVVAPTPVTTAGLPIPETKALGVMQSIVRLRGRLLDPETRAITSLLTEQRKAAIAVIADVAKDYDGSMEMKAIDTAILGRLERSLAASFAAGMTRLVERLHLRSLLGVFDIAGPALGDDVVVDDRLRARFMRDAGKSIAGITETTLRALASTLTEGVRAGESLDELTARVQEMTAFNEQRAGLVARTELAVATNRASLEAFEKGHVQRVRVHDGVEHDSACADLNGQEMTIEEARSLPSIAHPNCARSFENIIEAARSGLSNGHVDHKELVAA